MQARCKTNYFKRGGALISALFITALAAMIATALAVEEELLIHEGTLAMNADGGYLALQSMQDAAIFTIQNYGSQWLQGTTGAPIKPLQTPLKSTQIGAYTLSATIENAQGKFNINDLAYAANESNFVVLLQAALPTLSKQQAYAIANAIAAWMTTAMDDPYYASLTPPYRSAKNQLATLSELRLIRGVTPEIYTALEPYVTALPIKMPQPAQADAPQPLAVLTSIDINAASGPVLMAVNPGLNATQAESMVDCRQQFGAFSSVQDFMSHCEVPSGVSTLQNITAQSRYFLVHAETPANHTILSLNSLMVTVVSKKNKLKVMTVWQSFE